MTLKNILRQRYSGTFFDSKLLNVVGPAIDKLDRAAQTRKDVPLDPAIPPFSLRARSNGSWQQFGGERFVEAGDRLPSLLQDRGLVPAGAEIVEIGCGVGRYAMALNRAGLDYHYTGIDIDAQSIEWCAANLADPQHSFHLLDISNGAYNRSGAIDALAVRFDDLVSEPADLVFLWSVFTHMELVHIRHYLSEIRTLLKDSGTAMFSCFIYDDRESIRIANPHAYEGGYVANLERPMKQIAFPLEQFMSAISDAGLELVEDPILRAESAATMWPNGKGLGQDIFLVRPAK